MIYRRENLVTPSGIAHECGNKRRPSIRNGLWSMRIFIMTCIIVSEALWALSIVWHYLAVIWLERLAACCICPHSICGAVLDKKVYFLVTENT